LVEYYDLKHDHLEQFKDIFTKLNRLSFDNHNLSNSIRWFNSSLSAENTEDKIIDLAISLESCILFGLRDELNYRFSLRGAALLGNKIINSQKTSSILKALYKSRSEIVHNGLSLVDMNKGKDNVNKIPKKDLVTLIEQLTREIITEYLQRIADGNTLDKINEDLEDYILAKLSE
jgi:hypothetical protein